MSTGADTADAGRGFVLIEVLVAFVIAALGLMALFDATSTGVRAVDAADDYLVAVRPAQTRLAEVGITIPLAADETYGGVDRGYRWQIFVHPAMQALASDKPAPALFAVAVDVSWSGGLRQRAVHLDTLRVVMMIPRRG